MLKKLMTSSRPRTPRATGRNGLIHIVFYSLSRRDFGVIDFVRKCEFVLYSKQILDTGYKMLDTG
jgi:hypothetical protein